MSNNDAIAMVMFFSMTAFVGTVLILAHYARRRLQSQEITKAIEHGQPLPMKPPRRRRVWVDDMRTGVLLVSFSIGFFLFLWMLDGGEGRALALVPMFIGVGYLINSQIAKRYQINGNGEEGDSATPSPPERDVEAAESSESAL